MKRFIIILFLFISSFGLLKSETKDTTKFIIKDYGNVESITNSIMKSFLSNKFKSILIFCESNLDFYIEGKTQIHHELLTEYGLVSNLDDIFRTLKYDNFKILSAKNANNDTVLLVQIFLKEGYDEPDINVYFVLRNEKSIKSVLVK